MKMGNQTITSEFLLPGLPIELTTVLGNVLIIVLIRLDAHLHTPMYLFLSNLSFSDLCFSSVTILKLLQTMQSQDPSIPYAGCLTQMYFLFFADLESFLLVAMAYDRYVLCLSFLVLAWALTTSISLLHTLLMALLSFGADNVIPHFFCDMSALLKLACSDIQINEMVNFVLGRLVLIVPFLLIFSSYARVVSSILKVPSAGGTHKAFSACGSHLSVVSLSYGTIIGLYLCPSTDSSTVKETVMAMMYTVVTPMLNPFIYSLRNQDIKGALRRVFSKQTIQFSLRH
uniref:G-protein coupled receptors family 1 profile domain-containing protein n=1 Tax=Sus scrofa TaxID=9823 RepID=A0A8W4FB36_PIG